MAGLDEQEVPASEPVGAAPEPDLDEGEGAPAPAAPPPGRFDNPAPIQDLHKEWRTRQQRRDELAQQLEAERQARARADAENAGFRKMYGDLLAEGDPKKVPDFETQGQEWFRHQLQEHQRKLAEEMQPLREIAERVRRQEEARQQYEAGQREFAQREAHVRSLFDDAEKAYVATESGAGYHERIPWYMQRLEAHYQRQGYTPEQATVKRQMDFGRLIQEAQADGRNPAAHVDFEMWSRFGDPQVSGNGHQAPAPAAPQAPVARSTVQAQRLAASGLTNSLSSAPQSQPTRIAGGATVAELRQAAKLARQAGARGSHSELVGELTRPPGGG